MQMPLSTSPVGFFGILIFILIVDAVQYVVIILANMLKTMLYTMMPWLPIPQLLPYSVYDIHIYHVGVTFVAMLIFGLFSNHLQPIVNKLITALERYFSPPAVILSHSFSHQQSTPPPEHGRFHTWLLSLNLAKSTYVGFSLAIIFGAYFFILAFITIDQYLYNALFSIGVSTIILYANEDE